MPLTYDPPLKRGEKLKFVRQDEPDAPELVRCWLQQEPARQLVKLASVPILILIAEASYHAAYDHCTAAYLTQAGVANTMIRLEDIGIRGNGHMMMLEKNSDEIAARDRGLAEEDAWRSHDGAPGAHRASAAARTVSRSMVCGPLHRHLQAAAKAADPVIHRPSAKEAGPAPSTRNATAGVLRFCWIAGPRRYAPARR